MSTAQQDFRDLLQRGELVDVVTTYGNGRQERLREARVVETLRAAARLRFEDGAERMIPFKNIRRRARMMEPAPTNPVPVLAVPIVTPAPAPPPGPAPKATPMADVDAWLRMGVELLEPLDTAIADLRLHKEGLEQEKGVIENELDAATDRLRTLHAQREQVSKLVGVGLPDKPSGKPR